MRKIEIPVDAKKLLAEELLLLDKDIKKVKSTKKRRKIAKTMARLVNAICKY